MRRLTRPLPGCVADVLDHSPLERGPMWHRHWQRAMGFQTNQLLKAFGRRLKVVEYRDASEASDWKLGTRNRIMRLVGQRAKP